MQKKRRTPAKRSTASTAPSLKNINLKSDVTKPLVTSGLFLGGLWLGKKAIVMIDDVVNKADDTVEGTISGIFGVDGKKLLAPTATALIGLGLNKLISDKNFKPACYGAIGAAGLEVISTVFNKDLLAGFEEGTIIPGVGNLQLSEYELEKAVQEIENGGASGISDVEEAEVVEEEDFDAE